MPPVNLKGWLSLIMSRRVPPIPVVMHCIVLSAPLLYTYYTVVSYAVRHMHHLMLYTNQNITGKHLHHYF